MYNYEPTVINRCALCNAVGRLCIHCERMYVCPLHMIGGAFGHLCPGDLNKRARMDEECLTCEGTGSGAVHGVDGQCSACNGTGRVLASTHDDSNTSRGQP